MSNCYAKDVHYTCGDNVAGNTRPFTGTLGQLEYGAVQPPCETKQYGKGTPALNSARVDKYGRPVGAAARYDTVETMWGSVKLPVSDANLPSYLPTAADITQLSRFEDTRLQPQPVRYFR